MNAIENWREKLRAGEHIQTEVRFIIATTISCNNDASQLLS